MLIECPNFVNISDVFSRMSELDAENAPFYCQKNRKNYFV